MLLPGLRWVELCGIQDIHARRVKQVAREATEKFPKHVK